MIKAALISVSFLAGTTLAEAQSITMSPGGAGINDGATVQSYFDSGYKQVDLE